MGRIERCLQILNAHLEMKRSVAWAWRRRESTPLSFEGVQVVVVTVSRAVRKFTTLLVHALPGIIEPAGSVF